MKNNDTDKSLVTLFRKPSAVILFLAACVGAIIGVIGGFFQNAILWLTRQRIDFVVSHFKDAIFIYLVMFAISGLMALLGYYLVKRFAPEASGSGVQEIEGALAELRPVRWKRVLPVKFFGGLGTLASGMILGREGPTIQIGANLGECFSDLFKIQIKHYRHSLLAAGAAAGLTTAFNAPLSGIFLVIEEMHARFQYTVTSISTVLTSVICATISYRYMNGNAPALFIGQYTHAPLSTLWLYLLLGVLAAIVGVLFNAFLLWLQTKFQRHQKNKTSRFIITGALIGGLCGVLTLVQPQIVSDGFNVVHDIASKHFAFQVLFYFFIARFFLSIVCYISGAPGGIFSPMLGLGALLGALFGHLVLSFFPAYSIELGLFIIIGMGALFSATIQAPLTGVILIMEMTMNYQLGMPLLIACVSASVIAKLLGGRPLYSMLLEKTLAAEKQA